MSKKVNFVGRGKLVARESEGYNSIPLCHHHHQYVLSPELPKLCSCVFPNFLFRQAPPIIMHEKKMEQPDGQSGGLKKVLGCVFPCIVNVLQMENGKF
jgi:hypothetical protein